MIEIQVKVKYIHRNTPELNTRTRVVTIETLFFTFLSVKLLIFVLFLIRTICWFYNMCHLE